MHTEEKGTSLLNQQRQCCRRFFRAENGGNFTHISKLLQDVFVVNKSIGEKSFSNWGLPEFLEKKMTSAFVRNPTFFFGWLLKKPVGGQKQKKQKDGES